MGVVEQNPRINNWHRLWEHESVTVLIRYKRAMSCSFEEARILAVAKMETNEEASSPLGNWRVGAVRGKKKGARVGQAKQMQKVRLATLEAELEELHAWKDQMVQKIPGEQVETSVQPRVSQKGA